MAIAPDTALGASQAGRYLLVLTDQDVVEQRPVEIGELTDDGLRVVRSGLNTADRIVVGRLQSAIPGAKVKPMTEVSEAQR